MVNGEGKVPHSEFRTPHFSSSATLRAYRKTIQNRLRRDWYSGRFFQSLK